MRGTFFLQRKNIIPNVVIIIIWERSHSVNCQSYFERETTGVNSESCWGTSSVPCLVTKVKSLLRRPLVSTFRWTNSSVSTVSILVLGVISRTLKSCLVTPVSSSVFVVRYEYDTTTVLLVNGVPIFIRNVNDLRR